MNTIILSLVVLITYYYDKISGCDIVLKPFDQCGGRAYCIDIITNDSFLCRNSDGPWKDVCCPDDIPCTYFGNFYWKCTDKNDWKPIELPSSFGSSNEIDNFQSNILAIHNDFREKHHVSSLTWSSPVAIAATRWANNCVFQHESQNIYGENLGIITSISGSTESIASSSIVKAWYDEVNKYDFNDPGFSYDTGHFTQLVWKSTISIGCYMKHCPQFWLLVCRYMPPGNILGEFEDNILPI